MIKIPARPVVALLALAVLALGALLWHAPKVRADFCTGQYARGRSCERGYFSNRFDNNGSDVYYGGLQSYNLTSFLNEVRGKMACSGNRLTNGGSHDASGSAFIILTMLGYPAGTSRDVACQQYGRWAGLITQYDQAGLINWNQYINFTGNTYYQDTAKDNAWEAPSAATFRGSAMVVSFMNPNRSGLVYAIKHACANPVGDMKPLPPINRPPTGTLTAASCTQISGTAVDPDTPNAAVAVVATYSRSAVSNSGSTNAISHRFGIATPAKVRDSVYPQLVHVYAKDTATGQQTELSGSPRSLPACLNPRPDCAGFTVNPTDLDPNMPYVLRASVSYGSPAEAQAIVQQTPDKFYVRINGPGVTYANADVRPVQPAGSLLQVTINMPATANTGRYIVAWGVTGDIAPINCGGTTTSSFPVVNRPYFTVDGGDASAGAGMAAGGTDCAVAPNPVAGIVSWNRGAANGYAGAGTQYAALSLGRLQSFVTARQSSAMRPAGLAFANTVSDEAGRVNLGTGLYGGHVRAAACTPDYATASTATPGNRTISGRTVANGQHQIVYVKGDAYITGDIKFSGLYPNTAAIPSFTLVVEGNIYVAAGVRQLDGVYVAQSSAPASPDSGFIYTCALPDGAGGLRAAQLDSSLYGSCSSTLQINGSFIARQVWLLRSAGTLSTTPAEQFHYTPELWITPPFGTGATKRGASYDAVTSLPPVL